MDELKSKKTLVLIASPKPERYAYKAVKMLLENDHQVVAIGRREGAIDELKFLTGKPLVESVHTLTLYLNPLNQKDFYQYILALAPKRVIFNPGTENKELQQMLDLNKIQWEEACTLVLLSTGQF